MELLGTPLRLLANTLPTHVTHQARHIHLILALQVLLHLIHVHRQAVSNIRWTLAHPSQAILAIILLAQVAISLSNSTRPVIRVLVSQPIPLRELAVPATTNLVLKVEDMDLIELMALHSPTLNHLHPMPRPSMKRLRLTYKAQKRFLLPEVAGRACLPGPKGKEERGGPRDDTLSGSLQREQFFRHFDGIFIPFI